jgi:hypothetical protein
MLFQKILFFVGILLTHNILEPVLGGLLATVQNIVAKSLLKKVVIPFLSSYAHSSTTTCMFLPLY